MYASLVAVFKAQLEADVEACTATGDFFCFVIFPGAALFFDLRMINFLFPSCRGEQCTTRESNSFSSNIFFHKLSPVTLSSQCSSFPPFSQHSQISSLTLNALHLGEPGTVVPTGCEYAFFRFWVRSQCFGVHIFFSPKIGSCLNWCLLFTLKLITQFLYAFFELKFVLK